MASAAIRSLQQTDDNSGAGILTEQPADHSQQPVIETLAQAEASGDEIADLCEIIEISPFSSRDVSDMAAQKKLVSSTITVLKLDFYYE